MSTKNNQPPTEPVIRAGSGDKPGEIEGHVVPGKQLRERWGITTEKPPEEKPTEAAPKPEKKPRAAKPTVAPRDERGKFMSPLEIAELANEVVKQSKKEPEKKEPVTPVQPTGVELTAAQKKRVAVLQRMEKSNEANKGLADKFVASLSALAKYQSEWEKKEENKGKTFNLDDEEHSEFVSKNDVQWDNDEYIEALADMRAEEKTKPFEERFKAQETEVQRSKRANELMPKIIDRQRASAKTFFSQLAKDEFKGLLNEQGVIVPEVLQQVQAESREHRTVLGMAQQVETMSAELMAIASDIVPFNPKNPLHVEMFHFIHQMETDTRKLPRDQQLDAEGRYFATSEEWQKMTERERQDHWHLTDSDLADLYAADMADKAAKLLNEAETDRTSWAKKRGLIQDNPPERRQGATPQSQPQNRERSPVGQIAPRVAPTVQPKDSAVSSLHKRWTS